MPADAQNFGYPSGKLLLAQGGSLISMRRKPIQKVIAENLKAFMDREDCMHPNPHALAKATNGKVSASMIRYLLDPKRRTVTSKKVNGAPGVDKLEALAESLPKCEAWMLLHPDLERAIRAMDMERDITAKYGRQQEKQPH